jgi:sporulation protein YlmC with PRC-barrel domain
MKHEKRGRMQKSIVPVIAVAGALSLGAAPAWAQQQGNRATQSQQGAVMSEKLISAETLRDQKVVDNQNRDIGTITALFVDPQSGRIQRTNIEFSTSLFGSDHKYSVDWNKLKVNRKGNDVVVTLDESVVRRVQQAGKTARVTEGDGIYDYNQQDRTGGRAGMGSDRGQRQIAASQLSADQIRKIQQKLNQVGFHAGQVDGNWSSQTQTAMKNFQQTKKINATGQIDEQTLDELGLDADEFRGSK